MLCLFCSLFTPNYTPICYTHFPCLETTKINKLIRHVNALEVPQLLRLLLFRGILIKKTKSCNFPSLKKKKTQNILTFSQLTLD